MEISTYGIPVLSRILRALIVDDYATAIELVTDKGFNPNEKSVSTGMPVISAVINLFGNLSKVEDRNAFKTILNEVVKHPDFDPNITDKYGETVLMHIAKHKDFNWLLPFVLAHNNIDFDAKNFMKKDVVKIAESCGNNVFVNVVLMRKGQGNHIGLPKKRVGIKKKMHTVFSL